MIQELGRFEGRKFVYFKPFIMPNGQVVREIKVGEAQRESEMEELASALNDTFTENTAQINHVGWPV